MLIGLERAAALLDCGELEKRLGSGHHCHRLPIVVHNLTHTCCAPHSRECDVVQVELISPSKIP